MSPPALLLWLKFTPAASRGRRYTDVADSAIGLYEIVDDGRPRGSVAVPHGARLLSACVS